MRTNILIAANGTLLNPNQNNLLFNSPVDGSAGSSLFNNQVTLTFYNDVELLPNGLYVPVKASVVKTSLTGTIQFEVFSAADCPYPVDITPNDTINIATGCILQWVGITQALNITPSAISGAAYINILVDRN